MSAGGNEPGPAQALASVGGLARGGVPTVVLVARAAGQPDEVAQLRPTDAAASALSAAVRAVADAYQASEAIAYEPAGSPADGQVMGVGIATVPLLRRILDDSADLAAIPLYEPGGARLASLRLVAVRVDAGAGPVVFVQSLATDQVVARSKKFGLLLRPRGVVDVPDDELLLIGRDFLAVLAGGYAFFQSRKAFQQVFGLLDEIRAQAAETLRSVTDGLRIEGFDQMLGAVTGSPAMLGKMASIQRKLDEYPAYKAAMTMPKLVEFVQGHPECGVEVAGAGGDARLVFRNDAQHRFKILKLLDDDYLRSQLTTLDYESNSKSAPLGTGGR